MQKNEFGLRWINLRIFLFGTYRQSKSSILKHFQDMIIHLIMYPGITKTRSSTVHQVIQVANKLLAENPIVQKNILSYNWSRDSFEEYSSSFLVMERLPVNGYELDINWTNISYFFLSHATHISGKPIS